MILLLLINTAVFSSASNAHGGDLTPATVAKCSDQVAAELTFAERVRIKRFLVTYAASSVPDVHAPHVLRAAFTTVAHAALPKSEWPVIDANLETIGFESKDWHRSHFEPGAIARLRAGWGVLARAVLHAVDPLAEETFRQIEQRMQDGPATIIEPRQSTSAVISTPASIRPITLDKREHQRALHVLSLHGQVKSIKEPGSLNEAYRTLLTRITPVAERSQVLDELDEIALQPTDAVSAYNRVKARQRFIAAWFLLLRRLKTAPGEQPFSSAVITNMTRALSSQS